MLVDIMRVLADASFFITLFLLLMSVTANVLARVTKESDSVFTDKMRALSLGSGILTAAFALAPMVLTPRPEHGWALGLSIGGTVIGITVFATWAVLRERRRTQGQPTSRPTS